MKSKLIDARGETLIEVLASVLIGALSIALLFGAVMASSRMDKTAHELDEVFYENLSGAERRTPADSALIPADTKVTVTNTDPAIIAEAEVEVAFYGGKGALSYALGGTGP